MYAKPLNAILLMLWYETQQPGLAKEFYKEFAAMSDRLAITPFIYPVLHRNVRRAVLHRFPYLVWYLVQDSLVIVIACTHSKINPNKLTIRLK